MDENTLNLWRQIESYRRVNKGAGPGRSRLPAAPPPPSISE
jgi:hypothetical protein